MERDPPAKAPPSAREARLAAQLRANLRRRKAPPPSKPEADEPPQEA